MTYRYKLEIFSERQSQQGSSYDLFAEVSRNKVFLTVNFQLKGPLLELRLPKSISSPQRQDHLWETTCFEFFFGKPGYPGYWEVNLSPSHHWNIYRFSTYREGMIRENALTTLECQQMRSPSEMHLQCKLPLKRLRLEDESLELNVTTVLQTKTGEISYWAVTHKPREADFHHRQSFTIRV